MSHDYTGCQEPACALCDAYDDGYAAGKDKARWEGGGYLDRKGHIRDCQGAGCGATCGCPCHVGELRRTDLKSCSCTGYWYRRTCRHIIAYREAVALVQAQDAVNLAFGTREGAETSLYGPLRRTFERCGSNAGLKRKWRHFGARSTPSLKPIGR